MRKYGTDEGYCRSIDQWLGEDKPFGWSLGEWWVWQPEKVSLGLGLEQNSERLTGIFRGMYPSSSKETLKKRQPLLNVKHWKKS